MLEDTHTATIDGHKHVCIYDFRYMNRPVMSGPGLYDPTSIMNADELFRAQREGWFKLAFYLLSFFYYLYRYIALVASYYNSRTYRVNRSSKPML